MKKERILIMKKFPISALVCLGCLMIFHSICLAQNNGNEPSLIYLYGGISKPTISTEITIDSKELGTATTFNLEDELKLPDNPTTFYFKTILGRRAQFAFSILSLKRQGDSYITRSITFADSTYSAGAFVHSYLNTIYYSGTFRFAILYKPNANAGLSLGMRWMNMSAGMSATYNDETVTRDERLQVPMFLPGVYGNVEIIPSLFGRISVEYLRLNIAGTETSGLEAQFSGEYYLIRNLGLGIAYSALDFKANDLPENDISIRDIDYSINGFSFFAALRF